MLTTTAARCRDQLRTHDLLCRYGGDELVALLPDTDTEDAAAIAARLSAVVTATPVPAGDSTVPVSISIGHATAASAPDLTMLLGCADAALYAVKQAGRGHARGFEEIVPAGPALQTVGAAQETPG